MPNGPIAILGGSTGNGPQSIGNGKSIPWFVTRYFRRNEGSTDYATIPTVTLSGDFVIEFDALADDADVSGAFVGYGANTNNNVFISGRDISIRDNNSDTVSTTGDAFSSSIFNHVMIQKVGANVNITINGVLSGSGTSSGSFITDQLCSRQNGSLSFSGIMANLKIYDAGVLVRDYPINDNSNTLKDLASGQDGSIVNGTADQWQPYQKQTTGEWLGPELLPIIDFNSEWTESTAATVTGEKSFAVGAVGGVINNLLPINLTFRLLVSANSTPDTFTAYNANGTAQNEIGLIAAQINSYDFVSLNSYIYLRTTEASSYQSTKLSIKEVLNVA
jgi:hypothetical protein